MSAGGAFSTAFSIAFSTIGSVTYCAPGQAGTMEATDSPILFCMMPNDEVIGEEGNSNALINHNILVNRDICSRYFMNSPFPVYPELFMRIGLNHTESQDIYSELNTNGFLGANGFLNAMPSEIQQHIQNNQSDWPNFVLLSNQQKIAIANLIGVAYGSHAFYSNHNKRTIGFFDKLCDTLTVIENPDYLDKFLVYPNPATEYIRIDSPIENYEVELIKLSGKVLYKGRNIESINIRNFAPGVYVIRLSVWNYVKNKTIVIL